MRIAVVVFGLAVVIAACGGANKPAEPPRPAGPTCKSAGEHMVDTLVTAMEPRPPDEAVNKLIELIVVRCDADRWSEASRTCLATMKTPADADACGLSEAQQAALVRDQQAKFGGSKPPKRLDKADTAAGSE